MKFTGKRNKRKTSFCKEDPRKILIFAIGSLVGFGKGTEKGGQIPATVIAGGEGQGARVLEGT